MNNQRKCVLILFIPLLIACGFTPSTVVPFSPQSYIQGLWVPSEYTLEFMKESGYEFSTHSIEFMPDGTVVMTNIPSEWIFIQEPTTKGYYSGDGIWSAPEEIAHIYDLKIGTHFSTLAGDEADIELGTVLEYIEFVPVNKPEEVNWVTFQKCYPHLHITDEALRPLVTALNRSKRDALGFSPITFEDRIEIDGTIGTTDISMGAYTDFSTHGIFFRLIGNEYVWVFEQEVFTGPYEWQDHDASTWEETILLQYQTEERNGGPINELMIDYMGYDSRLINTSDNWYLGNDIERVLPIIEEWRQWRNNQPPSPQSLCP